MITNPWEKIRPPHKDVNVLRVDGQHPLDFFWAKDHLDRYLLIYELQKSASLNVKELPEIEGIETILTGSSNQVNRLLLILGDKADWELFYALSSDLLKATYNSKTPETATSIIIARLRRWQNFLKNKRLDVLPEEKIKGLIGELIFLKNRLIPKYGVTNSINFWEGPKDAPQDFNINDIAVEVKFKLGGTRPSVKISSAEQLYTQLTYLYLYVLTMGKSEESNKESINLNEVVDSIQILLENESSPSISKFNDLLVQAGYFPHKKYNDYNYILSNDHIYCVEGDFPRITPNELKQGVFNLSYKINLIDCAPYEISLEDWRY
jgi:hypothetical protein